MGTDDDGVPSLVQLCYPGAAPRFLDPVLPSPFSPLTRPCSYPSKHRSYAAFAT